MMIQKKNLPLLTIRDVIIFPGTVVPIFIGRIKSLNALLSVKKINNGHYILISTQKKHDIEDPKVVDLFNIGVLAKIIQTIKLPNNNAKILVEVMNRVKFLNITNEHNTFIADFIIVPDTEITDLNTLNNTMLILLDMFKKYIKINKKINLEMLNIVNEQKNPSYIINIISSYLRSDIFVKQALLEETNIQKRAEQLIKIISLEIKQINTEQDIQNRVKEQIEKTQKNFYLNEQIKAIQKEMNIEGNGKCDLEDLEYKIKEINIYRHRSVVGGDQRRQRISNHKEDICCLKTL